MPQFQRRSLVRALGAALILASPAASFAVGGPSGMQVNFERQGDLGEVVVNPYDIAPLTAVIRNGGEVLERAHVRVVPKKGGVEIAYDVGPVSLRTYGGIPVFGLYPEHLNEVEVSWRKRTASGPVEKTETYRIWTPPVYLDPSWTHGRPVKTFETKVVKAAPEDLRGRLYLINNLLPESPKGSRAVWNNPSGGALQWNNYPQNAVLDTTGEVRWYLEPSRIYDPRSLNRAGIMMGFHQNPDGALSWGYGQRYVKYDLMGRGVFDRPLPDGYADFSHAMAVGPDGRYFLRVASADLKRPDGSHVHTVRDVVIEVDRDGRVLDEWRLFEILDPNRSIVLKSIDQGAVCLNVDLAQSGKTLSAEQIARLDARNAFGDISGTGAGRNWAHVNSVDYDPTDDSIIVSSRHQSAVIKIGRDKRVKWILGAPNGWTGELKDKVLTPVDAAGRPIPCRIGRCEGRFDWTWTQHTGWKVKELSRPGVSVVTVFDNGDGRGFSQPENPKDKYSRAVMYSIDEQKGTVEQLWEYGRERGHELYSAITSSVEYEADRDTLVVYWASIGVQEKTGVNPVLTEFRRGGAEPVFEMRILGSMGYRATVVDPAKAFNP
ncbi:aryl-sulfate sulfotransferase [Sutterella sp.]|uniref:aryl-sulfate sulfotransferase n=1 Tax=Sutterella sp. TaxID=1981025 RepID=UPI0025F1EE00|nr:aryl-sulfate sulfotransferase [uncultured Sutterella sp.]